MIVSIQCIFQLNFHIILVSTSQSRICEFISNTKILIIFQNIQVFNVFRILIICNIHLILFTTIIKYGVYIFSQQTQGAKLNQMVILGMISFIVILQQLKQIILCLFGALTFVLIILISIFLIARHQSSFKTTNPIYIKPGNPLSFYSNEKQFIINQILVFIVV